MARRNTQAKASEPEVVANPQSAIEFVESGWNHYSKKEYSQAELDFQKALELEPDNADTQYALAMTLMADARSDEAVKAFEKVISMLPALESKDPVRAHMLNRLAMGHINRIQTGDWGINK